jgi:uncharacterized membrane protein YraQ (UPF0718 family)
MAEKRRKRSMLIPTAIMGALAMVLLLVGYFRGQGEHLMGMKSALTLVVEILPLLFFAFIVAGMVQVLLPREVVSKWVGVESGMRGIIVGTLAGGLTPGGPFVSMPIAVGLLHSGASVGTLVAFLTAWSLWAFARLPMEVGILGWKFTVIRVACTFFFPPIAGFIAQTFFAGTKLVETI